jgi:hypothetical protein
LQIRASRNIFDARQASKFKALQHNSLRNGTGNFRTRIRENFSRNREFNGRRSEPPSFNARWLMSALPPRADN